MYKDFKYHKNYYFIYKINIKYNINKNQLLIKNIYSFSLIIIYRQIINIYAKIKSIKMEYTAKTY